MAKRRSPQRFPSVSVLGVGRAGGSVAVLLARQGWPVQAVWSRRMARARTVARRVRSVTGQPVRCPSSVTAAASGSVVLVLAVPDEALTLTAAGLAGVPGKPTARVALHLSGALGPEVLAPLTSKGVHVGSCHPLAVLPDHCPPVDLLDGACFAIDGDRTARALARRVAVSLGGTPLLVKGPARPAYHLAAALVANDTAALFELALRQLAGAGIPAAAARHGLGHLLQATATALAALPVERAITGPVVRGDTATLDLHLRAADRQTAEVHRHLSKVLLDVAVRAGRLDHGRARRLARHLAAASVPRARRPSRRRSGTRSRG